VHAWYDGHPLAGNAVIDDARFSDDTRFFNDTWFADDKPEFWRLWFVDNDARKSVEIDRAQRRRPTRRVASRALATLVEFAAGA
jgi:hypothetical protein